MRLINKILIVIFICAKNSIHALPVQSKALENVDDQLFWQAAWFSEDSNDRAASPFASESKRISPKSIFIIPEKSSNYCAPGYRIDGHGKCIKVVNVQQTSEESKLASLITTDDTANFDYDYWNEEDDNEYIQTTDNLPLVPILNESNESNDNNKNNDDNNNSNNSNENAKKVIIKETHLTSVKQSSDVIATSQVSPTVTASQTFQNFHQHNKSDAVQVIIATLSSDNYGWESSGEKNESNMMTYDHDTITTSVNEFKNRLNDENEEKFESHTPSTFLTTTTTTIAPFEYENMTEMNSTSSEEATSVMQDRIDADSQNVEPLLTNGEESNITSNRNDDEDDLVEYGASNETTLQTEDTIIEKINFDDVSLMQNESLLMSYENVNSTSIDYEDVTTQEPLNVDLTSSTEASSSFLYEGSADDSENSPIISTTLDLDDQSFKYESYNGDQESANKFIYQHLTTSITSEKTTTEESIRKIKFPSDEQSGRIKFPDDQFSTQSTSTLTSKFVWPRENHKITTNIFRFWNQQPLIADSIHRSRENSKSFRDNYFPYTRNQKVQIVTPQQRYS